uniref:Zinc finger PHD-type domain-containing protein n=1 Tax=Aegilops tauschii subsp. strangulata TaxID=200361 RepID=A0A453HGF0_AEGTS
MKSCHQRMRACQLGNTFSVTSSSSMMRSSTLIQCNLISQNIFMNMPTDLRWSFWTASSSSSIMTWKRISCLKTNLCCTSGAKWSYWIRATVADLKMEAARTFQSIYLMLQSFVANQLLDCPTADDTTQVKLLFGAKGTVSIQGKCVGGERRVAIYRMERGVDKWTVNCSCGAKDDDGERMLSCDSCHVWQHTRCVGISDFVQVPKRFVCASCKLLHKSKMYSSFPNKRCKTGSFSHASSGLWRPNIS